MPVNTNESRTPKKMIETNMQQKISMQDMMLLLLK